MRPIVMEMRGTSQDEGNADAFSAPIVFPYFMGPGVRGVTTALLYNGRLVVSMPGWLAPGPIETFLRLHDRVVETAHLLCPIFDLVAHLFELAQIQAQYELKHLKPLEDKITRALVARCRSRDQLSGAA